MKGPQDLAERLEAERATDRNRVFSYLSRVSTKRKYVYINTPKVAGTTVKLALNQLEGHPDPKVLGAIHEQGQRLSDFSVEENVVMLSSPDWFRFTFVRNPYDRLLSAYKSKVGIWGREYGWLQDRIRDVYGYPSHPNGWLPVVAFRDFVHYLIEKFDEPRIGGDGHFSLQTTLHLEHLIQYDFVGRYEHFAEEFREVLTRLGAPEEVKDRAEEVYNPTHPIHHAIAYDRDLASPVYDHYREDFERFGYDKDSWMYDADSPAVVDWAQPTDLVSAAYTGLERRGIKPWPGYKK